MQSAAPHLLQPPKGVGEGRWGGHCAALLVDNCSVCVCVCVCVMLCAHMLAMNASSSLQNSVKLHFYTYTNSVQSNTSDRGALMTG